MAVFRHNQRQSVSLHKKILLTALGALLAATVSPAQEFSENFSSDSVPAGWTPDPVFNYGNRDFANGRMNAYPTDAGVRLLHPLTVPASAAKVVLRYTGNSAPSNIGETTWIEVRTTTAQQYLVQHGFGDPERASGTMSSRVTRNDLGNPANYSFPAYQQMPKVFDTFSYVITFEDGQITHQILRGGLEYFQQSALVPEFRIAQINQVGIALYTTTQASVWMDDFSVSFPGSTSQIAAFVDNFDSLNTTRWQNVSGSWSVNNGQLIGYWDPGAAQSQHANLLLNGQNLELDYDATFSAVLGNGATGFSLYRDAGNKYNINVSSTGVSVERLANFSNYALITSGPIPIPALSNRPSAVKVVRHGAEFTVFVDARQIAQFTDNHWGGTLRLGLRAYSTAVYDAFAFNEPLDPDCELLQQALNDALAALAQANAIIADLTEQLAAANADKQALQQQLTQANADKALLQSQLDAANVTIVSCQQLLAAAQAQIAQLNIDKAGLQQQLAAAQTQIASLVTANADLQQLLATARTEIAALQGGLGATAVSLTRVQSDFRAEFNDPAFTIPGATTAAQVDHVADAIIRLNHGRKQDVYNALK